jgi:hypothetical protein
MDSEDEMEWALNRDALKLELAERKQLWLGGENTRRRISNLPPLGPENPYVIERWGKMEEAFWENYPGMNGNSTPEEEDKPTTLEFDTYEMVANLLNRLESKGENLLAAYDETGSTELSGETHSLVFDMDSARWVIKDGRGGSE